MSEIVDTQVIANMAEIVDAQDIANAEDIVYTPAEPENQHYVHTDDVERHPNAERRVQQYADRSKDANMRPKVKNVLFVEHERTPDDDKY